MDNNQQFYYRNILYTKEKFAEQLLDEEQQSQVDEIIAVLEKKGLIKFITNSQKEEKAFIKAMKEQEITNHAEILEQSEEEEKDIAAQTKKEGRLLYPKVTIDFDNYNQAIQCQNYIETKLRIHDSELIKKNSCIKLIIKNISDKDLDKINLYYKTGNIIKFSKKETEKAINTLTDGIDYTAKNIVAPSAKIVIKSGVKVGSTIASTAVKVGATSIDAISKGIAKTTNDIKDDPDIIKATSSLISLKDKLKNKFFSSNTIKKGITIDYDED